jgi:hypothetical protein
MAPVLTIAALSLRWGGRSPAVDEPRAVGPANGRQSRGDDQQRRLVAGVRPST